MAWYWNFDRRHIATAIDAGRVVRKTNSRDWIENARGSRNEWDWKPLGRVFRDIIAAGFVELDGDNVWRWTDAGFTSWQGRNDVAAA